VRASTESRYPICTYVFRWDDDVRAIGFKSDHAVLVSTRFLTKYPVRNRAACGFCLTESNLLKGDPVSHASRHFVAKGRAAGEEEVTVPGVWAGRCQSSLHVHSPSPSQRRALARTSSPSNPAGPLDECSLEGSQNLEMLSVPPVVKVRSKRIQVLYDTAASILDARVALRHAEAPCSRLIRKYPVDELANAERKHLLNIETLTPQISTN